MALPSVADTWAEVLDAGDLSFNSQLVTTSGPLNTITGNLSPNSGDGIDLYQISITDPLNFGASTVGGATWDTELYLFDSSGHGVAANDDSGNFASPNHQSRFGGASPISGLLAGTYFLGIGFSGSLARDLSNVSLFSSTSGNGTPNGAAAALQNWGTPATPAGSYSIAISGVGPVPEPASIATLVIGGLALLRRRKKA